MMELEDFEKLTKEEQISVLLSEKKDELSKARTEKIVSEFAGAKAAAFEAFETDAKKRDTDAEANWMKVRNQIAIERNSLVSLWSAKENEGYDISYVPETTINKDEVTEV